MSKIWIDILSPKAFQILKELEAQKLIHIESESGHPLIKVLEKLRSASSSSPGPNEITAEVEKIRAKRHAR